MTNEEKFSLITRNLEETLTEGELKALIQSGERIQHYIGFEISGKGHVGWVYLMQKINDLQEAGVEINILLADWHTWLNKKLDGTLPTAKRLAREYFEEGLKAAALCSGANPEKINFILGSELYEKLSNNYWAKVIKVAKATTLARMVRSTTIMGRKESEISDTAMLIYPAMQSADIFALGVNLVHAGTDQRNVHVVAREAASSLEEEKPVAIHHHLLLGLSNPFGSGEYNAKTVKLAQDLSGKGNNEDFKEDPIKLAFKMSKSKPDSAIFITDSPEEIKRKVNNAYCPEGVVEFNPILDWSKHLVFYQEGSTLEVTRKEEHGGNVIYKSYWQLETDYKDKRLHPQDLKLAVAEWLIQKLEPARKYFEDPKRKAALEEIEMLTSR